MIIILNDKRKNLEVSSKMKIREILKKEKINPETVIPIKKGEVVSLDSYAKDTDEITLFKVISGG